MKKIYSFFLSLCFGSVLFAQSPIWGWAKSGGGTLYDQANDVACTAGGDVYVVGGFESGTAYFGSQSLTNAMSDSLDIFVTKYDGGGNVVWTRRAGGARNDEATSVAVDNNGNIVVTGYFYSSALIFNAQNIIGNHSGYSDCFVVMYDPSGNVIWAKSIGGQYDDCGNSVAIEPNGQALVTGYFLADTLFMGIDTLMCTGNYDMFVTKFTGMGNFIWSRSAGTVNDDRGTAIAVDNALNVVVGGTFHSNIVIGNDTLNYAGGAYSDIFLVKYDQNGIVQWAISEGGTYLDEAKALKTDVNGNIFMAAQVYSAYIVIGSDSLVNSGTSFYCDVVLAEYNSSGIAQWADISGVGTGNDIIYGVTVDSSGNPFITGVHSPNIVFGSEPPLAGIGMFIVRYTAWGTVYWATSVTGVMGTGIAFTNGDHVVVCGMLYDPSAAFDAHVITNAGIYDAFTAWIDQVLPVPENNSAANISVYPNPAGDVIYIDALNPQQTTHISIMNALGELVQESELAPGENSMNISHLAGGVYFAHIREGENAETVKQFIVR